MKKSLVLAFVIVSSVCSFTFASEDLFPPTPNPSQWLTPPTVFLDGLYYYHNMTAVTAVDASGPVEYYFQCIDGGGISSGWILSPTYTAGGFWTPNNSTYRFRTRDNFGNVGQWSDSWNTYFGKVPEPATMTLFALSSLLLRRKK